MYDGTRKLNLAEVIEILQESLKQNFRNKTLEQNRDFLIKLENVQSVIFDRAQRYGNPNYEHVPIELDLITISCTLRTTIAQQFSQKELDGTPLETLLEDFKYLSDLGYSGPHYNRAHGFYRKETEKRSADTAKIELAKYIFSFCKKKMSRWRSKKAMLPFIQALHAIRGSFNESTEISKQISSVLEKRLKPNTRYEHTLEVRHLA